MPGILGLLLDTIITKIGAQGDLLESSPQSVEHQVSHINGLSQPLPPDCLKILFHGEFLM